MREVVPQVTPFLRLGGREWYLPAALRAFTHPNYRLYWFGMLISLTGTWMQSTAQQWLVYSLTGSPLALGAVMFLNSLPAMLFSLFAGVVVDRVDKRRFLIWLQIGMMVLALILAALTCAGLVQYWHVLVLATLLGLANTFDMPTRQAFTVELVGKDDLMNAIALNSSMFNGARLIGPAVAGLLVARLGEAAAFAFNGLSFLAVIGGLLLMRLPAHQPKPGRLRPLADLREGLGYIRRDHAVLALVLVAAAPSLVGFPATTLLPAMARDVLGLGADGFGALVSALGFGALLGAMSLAALGHYRPKGRLLTVAMFVFALALFAAALSRTPLLTMVALAFAGWGMVNHLATTNTLLQLHVPDELRGRVMSAYLWAVVGLAPFGSLLLGTLAEWWSAPTALVIGAGLCFISALSWLFVFPELRRME
jgi:MFS family permease